MAHDTPTGTSDPGAGAPSRRLLIGGLVGLPVLAACGSESSSTGASGSTGTTSSGPIATTADIPVGGGKIFAAEKVVITQPTAGEFKAFSAICTHQGCPVSEISGEEIDCTCHGSKFSIADGSVLDGPADAPLESLTVTADGEDLSLG